jgi:hypothetical protein
VAGDSEKWREEVYRKALEDEISGLRKRIALGGGRAELEGTLKNLYINDGADWAGRGELQAILLSAAIAAHELIIAELRPG